MPPPDLCPMGGERPKLSSSRPAGSSTGRRPCITQSTHVGGKPTMKKYLKISSAVIVAILVIAGIAGASSKKTSKTSVSTPTT